MTGEQRNKQRKSSTARRAERFNDVEWVNAELSEAQKKALKNTAFDLSDADDGLTKLLEGGYRVSLKWDEHGECFAAYVQQLDPEGDNAGAILSGRGSTPVKAVKQALFKHFSMLQGDWTSARQKPSKAELDD